VNGERFQLNPSPFDDTDHRGVSNVQLCKENEAMAALYKNKSVAEQNSLDIAWAVLMSNNFKELRATLFVTRDDLLRFRQNIVKIVLATDIFDKELNDLRKNRWDGAFGDLVTTKSVKISAISGLRLLSSTSCRLQTCRTRCSIGTFTESGTTNYSMRCSKPTNKVAWARTPRSSGLKVSSDSSTTTSFHWRKS
jgi:hypothetical protein